MSKSTGAFNHKLFLDCVWKHSMRLNVRQFAMATGLPTAKARKIRQGQMPNQEIFFVLCKWMGQSPQLFMLEAAEEREPEAGGPGVSDCQ